MAEQHQPAPAIRRPREVFDRLGLSKSTVYAMVRAGTFPKPIPLGARAVGWLESDLSAWIERQAQAARGGVRA